jgi:hypothetical protein
MNKYKVYSWFSSSADMGYGCYPTIEIAEENKTDASESMDDADDLELYVEEMTIEQLREERCYEVLEFHGLNTNGIDDEGDKSECH